MTSRSRHTWALYCRAYLLTTGFLLSLGSAIAVYLLLSGMVSMPLVGVALLVVSIICALGITGVGLFGSNARMDRWAEMTSSHDASLVVGVISYPVYLIVKRFYKSR